jgi:alpha-glucosidase
VSETSRPWWQTAVIYQIYPRSFQDTTGNGVGDLPGITHRLDYLSDTLGIDAIWISPFYRSPMADFGYDVADYTDVDPRFGTLADFDRLLAAAHARGLAVIIDWVPNHTSNQHPWFLESRSSRDNPKRDWYFWRDPRPDGSLPNNWLSAFGGPAWEWDEETGQYYLHTFVAEQADLNWRNPEVEEAMFDTVRFWMDRGVDGLRIDVAHFIMKDPDLRDNPPAPPEWRPRFKPHDDDYESLLHVHDMGHPDVHGVHRRLRRLLDGYRPERFTVGEIHISDWAEWASYYGSDLDGLNMPFNFSLLHTPWSAAGIGANVAALEAALPPGAWPNYVLGNHDEIRLTTRIGPAAARAAAVLLLTLRGTPTLYYGDELGITEAAIAPEDQQDPWGRNVPGAGRDGCRTPMEWDRTPHAGFSRATVESTWLPVGGDAPTRNVAAQLDDPVSLLNLYRRLLAYRRASRALQVGDYHPLPDPPDDCLVFERVASTDRVLVAINFTAAPREVPLPAGARVAISTDPSRSATGVPDAPLVLGPNEAVIAEP